MYRIKKKQHELYKSKAPTARSHLINETNEPFMRSHFGNDVPS